MANHLERLQSDYSKMNLFGSPKDPHSFAKPEFARVTHTHLELNVNFERKILTGKAFLTIKTKLSTNELILDNNGLEISNITSFNGTHLTYYFRTFNEAPPNFGIPIYIQLSSETIVEPGKSDTLCGIQIEYATNPKSPALNWLTPAQTADNQFPFLLSDNKPMYARTMFPCQDTPSVKFTYSAKITVQEMYTVLMSACSQEPESKNDLLEYSFFQTNPIPAYAVTIAVGKLENIHLNSRTNIFSERKFIETCRKTFCSDVLGRMLRIAENLYGSYNWQTYNICVLPPSIDHFKIECPCVLFISSVVLGTDDSFISQFLAPGISQYWAGHLVTCSNYEHLWLNKSISLFISRKIICKMLDHYRDMNKYFERKGLFKMKNMIELSKVRQKRVNCLLPNFSKSLPDTAYVPYEKGYMLLRYLEDMLGESVLESFLKCYFHNFAYESIKTQDWVIYLSQYIHQFNPDKINILYEIDWIEYFRDILIEIKFPEELSAMEKECSELRNKWIEYSDGVLTDIPFTLISRDHFCDLKKITFLIYLRDSYKKLSKKSMELLSNFHSFNTQADPIRAFWLLLCIKVRWVEQASPALEFAVQFCSNYAKLIFEELYKWPEMRDKTIKTYADNREKMFYSNQKTLDALLFQS